MFKYIIAIVIILLIIALYFFRYRIVRFISIPTPMIGYSILKYLPIQDQLLLSLIKMRHEVSTRFHSIDIVPIILCLGHKPFNIQNSIHINKFMSYTITGKQVLLHIMPEYYLQTLEILQSIWHGKPYHAIVVNTALSNISTTSHIFNDLNVINKVFSVKAPVFMMFDYDIPNNTFSSINAEIGFEINNASINNLHELWNAFLQKLLHIILLNNVNMQYDTIQYLQSHENEIVNYIFQICNCSMVQGVYFYNSLAPTKSLPYILENIVYEACSTAVFSKHNIFSRRNKLILFITSIISIICGVYVIRFYNKSFEFLNSAKEVEAAILNHDTNILHRSSNVLEYNPSELSRYIVPMGSLKLENFKSTITKIMQNELTKKQFLVTSTESFMNPTNTETFTELKRKIKTLCEDYNRLLPLRHREGVAEYIEHIKDNIIRLHDEWLKTFTNFATLKMTNKFILQLDTIYTGQCSLKDYNNLILNYHELNDLLASYNSWWLNNTLDTQYDKLISRIKSMPYIGVDLVATLNGKREVALNTLKTSLLRKTHPLIHNKEIFIYTDSIKFSQSAQEFVGFIQNTINHPILSLNGPQIPTPDIDENHLLLWNEQEISRIINIRRQYEQFIQSLNTQNTKVIQSLTYICNKILQRYIYAKLANTSTIVSNEYPLNLAAANIGNTYLALNDIQKFTSITLTREIDYIKNINRKNIINMTNRVRQVISNSILTNYKFINEWNEDRDIIKVLFGKPATQLPDIVENMVLQFKNLNSQIVDYLINPAQELSSHEYEYLKYLRDTMIAYESGARNDLAEAKDFLISLPSLLIKSTPVQSPSMDISRDLAFHTQIFRTSMQTRMNEIVLSKSKVMFNRLVNYYNTHLRDKLPFAKTIEGANIDHIIHFIKMYQEMRPHLIEDTELPIRYPSIVADMKFLDTLCNFFKIENDSITIHVGIEDVNHLYPNQCSNINMILKYIHKFGSIIHEDQLSVVHNYTINQGYIFTLQIVNTSEMEIAPYIREDIKGRQNITTQYNKMIFNHNRSYGLFTFVEELFFERKNEDVILRIPVSIFASNSNMPGDKEDLLVTYLAVKNFPNIRGHVLQPL